MEPWETVTTSRKAARRPGWPGRNHHERGRRPGPLRSAGQASPATGGGSSPAIRWRASGWTDTRTVRWGSAVLNGDGSLLYPGNAVGYTGPVVSARLKALRDGMEDYEYLKILAGIIGAAGVDTLAGSVATGFTAWNRSAANLQAVREVVAQRIQSP